MKLVELWELGSPNFLLFDQKSSLLASVVYAQSVLAYKASIIFPSSYKNTSFFYKDLRLSNRETPFLLLVCWFYQLGKFFKHTSCLLKLISLGCHAGDISLNAPFGLLR